jgi:predicted nucleic acid-binding protein
VKFTLDSTVLIDALRSDAGSEAFVGFMHWARHHVFVSAVVVAELEAGARSAAARDRLEAVIAPFDRRNRVVAPTFGEWRRAGRLLAELPDRTPALRQNDALLATQARNLGWVVITRDRDFGELRARIPGLQVMPPFPMPRRP